MIKPLFQATHVSSVLQLGVKLRFFNKFARA